MKKLLLIVTITMFTSTVFAANSNPFLRARIPVGTYETLVKAVDLPDTETFQLEDGQYFDIGYKYTYFHIVFIPLWVQSDGQSVIGISGDGESYLDLSEEDMAFLKENNIEVPTEVKPTFWHSIGGKLVALGIIGFFIFLKLRGGDEEEEAAPAQEGDH